MTLFIGGPADGWRIKVESETNEVRIPLNPHPPGFTTDAAVYSASTIPYFLYKREAIVAGDNLYFVFVPQDWQGGERILEALLNSYPTNNEKYERQAYTTTAEGTLYDTDDRIQDGRPYRL